MDRRDFSRGLIAAGMAAPVLGTGESALANPSGSGRDAADPFDRLSRLMLILTLRRIMIDFLIIMNPTALLALDLRNPMPIFNEDRANLGGLFRPLLSRRFSAAEMVGQVFLFQSLLLIAPVRRPIRNVQKTVILHRSTSYQPKTIPAPARMSNLPQIGALPKVGTLLGSAHQRDRELLVLVRPTILDADF